MLYDMHMCRDSSLITSNGLCIHDLMITMDCCWSRVLIIGSFVCAADPEGSRQTRRKVACTSPFASNSTVVRSTAGSGGTPAFILPGCGWASTAAPSGHLLNSNFRVSSSGFTTCPTRLWRLPEVSICSLVWQVNAVAGRCIRLVV